MTAGSILGRTLGRYRIVEQIGAGGMGVVYRAHDERLERDVALKVLPQGALEDEAARKRFRKEALTLSRLNHPNIATVHDFDTQEGIDFLVTELISGTTLAEKLRERRLPEKEILALGMQMAAALEEAHEHGTVHRDFKSSNVMVTAKGQAKVLDFGLAKLLHAPGGETVATLTSMETHTLAGTLPYMAPEQLRGENIDARTDIHALGAVLYEMATGRRPFEEISAPRLTDAILHQAPAPPRTLNTHISAELERITLKCLEKDPENRYQSAKELIVDLRRLQSGTSGPTVVPTVAPSIAVLPFASMSADEESKYFGDGLAEEIINALAHAPGIKVAGRTSSFFFRGKDIEFGEIGRRLNVGHLLEGSVRKAGKHVRVTAQLIKVADGFHIWSERYDREMTDIFAIQDEMTQAIVTALRVKLSSETTPARRHEPNLRAYEAYLKAREQWFMGTAESQARFKEFLDQAVECDPKFPLPYFLLGAFYSMLANLGIRPAREMIPLGRAAEQEALRLEPSLPEAHAQLACFAGYEYDWDEAEREWRLAMASEPASLSAVKASDIRFWYGNHYLLPIGRPAEALEAEASGLDEDPLNLLYGHLYALALQHAGRAAEAEAELRKVMEVDEEFPPALGTLGRMCAQQGRLPEALTLTERAHALTPWANVITGQLAALLVRTGAASRAAALIERLRSSKDYLAPTGLAVFHALCGEFDRAAEWAERGIEERYGSFIAVLGPLLRPTPQWPALLKLMNLPR